MRRILFVSLITAGFVIGCSSDPLKYRVDSKLISGLPAGKMGDANRVQEKVTAAKRALDLAKEKLVLTNLELHSAVRFYEAAQFHVKAVKERLALQNKGIPMKVEPGELENAVSDMELAKRNLDYRRLVSRMHEKQAKHLELAYQHHRAQYFEEVVNVIHSTGMKEAEKMAKSTYMRQAADRKIMTATALEEVERDLAKVKSLKAEIEAVWAPRLQCKGPAPTDSIVPRGPVPPGVIPGPVAPPAPPARSPTAPPAR